MSVVSFEELSSEEKLRNANRVYGLLIKRFAEKVEKEFGEKGRKLMDEAFYEVGRAVGEELKEKLNIIGNKPEDYAKLHYYQDVNIWGIKEEIEILANGDVNIRVSYCPLENVYKGKDCARFISYVKGLIDSINPDLKWEVKSVKTSIRRGGVCCHFVVKKGTTE